MKHTRTWATFAGAGLLALGLAGCGGGGSSIDPSAADGASGATTAADGSSIVVTKAFTAAQFQGTKIVPVVVPGIVYGAGDREGRATQAGLGLPSGPKPAAD